MDLFKKRLKELVSTTLFILVASTIIVGIGMGIQYINPAILSWIGIIIGSAFGLMLVYIFIEWLFIEPFKKSRGVK